ncbi:MAG: DNA polymerase [Gemmataceae bacterium]|uniref:DNA polymerase n=1 Tax=Thermogemmata fonticola TaxID=2755323 RepID=A0A7V8VEC8_9BACT|nr:helix-hairpin-helix domain-containing protein [Thermogemmata fonticola]MBA2226442.1 DNA polymerase [Thermogemmata fonticola]MCX8139322.1 DNA polymerase [Gemmataceae bacterium]GIW84885.1 MAG: DNA polymerase IV [Gemmataceae bacterium]
MTLRKLFIDMNAFFASIEQQDDPTLRGRPVAVIPTDAPTTCCIAASYEAKRYGVRTGTPVWQARQLCPSLVFRLARHRRYVLFHQRILDAVETVLPIEKVLSIDEMTCSLGLNERSPQQALALANAIKQAIRTRVGECLTCSIGIAPNTLLAKVAADMRKPDGLTLLTAADLPHALHSLQLTDFPGIGPRMLRRLHSFGITSVRQLCAAPLATLSAVWKSKKIGERWHRLLHGGEDEDLSTARRSLGHSHVLPPPLRNDSDAYGVLTRLTHKAAARLRKEGYCAGCVSIHLTFLDSKRPVSRRRWSWACRIPHAQDTPAILRAVNQLWQARPQGFAPFHVGVLLTELRSADCTTPSLFDDNRRSIALSHTLDVVNTQCGPHALHFASIHDHRNTAPTRIAFTQIPCFDRAIL